MRGERRGRRKVDEQVRCCVVWLNGVHNYSYYSRIINPQNIVTYSRLPVHLFWERKICEVISHLCEQSLADNIVQMAGWARGQIRRKLAESRRHWRTRWALTSTVNSLLYYFTFVLFHVRHPSSVILIPNVIIFLITFLFYYIMKDNTCNYRVYPAAWELEEFQF